MSRQKIFAFLKNLEKAAALAPEYEPISNILIFFFFKFI